MRWGTSVLYTSSENLNTLAVLCFASQRSFLRKTNEHLNLFSNAYYIFVVGYDNDGRGHDITLGRLLQMNRKEKLKTKINSFQMNMHSLFCEIISSHDINPPKLNDELLRNFSPGTTEFRKPLCQLTHCMYMQHDLYERAKALIKMEASITFAKDTMKKCFDSNADVNLPLADQIHDSGTGTSKSRHCSF